MIGLMPTYMFVKIFHYDYNNIENLMYMYRSNCYKKIYIPNSGPIFISGG